MRNGTKLRQILSLYDMHLSMDDEGTITLTLLSLRGQGKHRKEGTTFSAALDKAYRQMVKDLKEEDSNQ